MSIFNYFIKRKIPKEVFTYEKKILHLTDTPDVIFPYLKQLIAILKPEVIIHTGDLVDNIKLEISRNQIEQYEYKVKKLLTILRHSNPKSIYIAKGNHDDDEIIQSHLKENEHLIDESVVSIYDQNFLISHKYTDKFKDYHFHLFGHSPSISSHQEGNKILLNGLFSIHVIDVDSDRISHINYPSDTDYFRQKKFKLGL